jgi:hypothetical protein
VGMTNLITKLLGPPEEIGAGGCFPAQLHRWLIFGNQHFKVYLHHSSQADLTEGSSPHPGRLISIGLGKSSKGDSGGVLGTSADRAAWMVLIAKAPLVHQGLQAIDVPPPVRPVAFHVHSALGLGQTCYSFLDECRRGSSWRRRRHLPL